MHHCSKLFDPVGQITSLLLLGIADQSARIEFQNAKFFLITQKCLFARRNSSILKKMAPWRMNAVQETYYASG